MDTSNIDLFVYTEREGALSAVGHDLKLRATDITVDRDGEDVRVTVAADSLKVEACIVDGGEKPVSAGDRKKIEKNARKDVLGANKHPEIVFEGTLGDRSDDSYELAGELTLKGETNPVALNFVRDGDGWRGEATLDQTRWGITPYKAFLGTLKVKPEVRVVVFHEDF